MTAVVAPWETSTAELPDELSAFAERSEPILRLLSLAFSTADATNKAERDSLTARAWKHMPGLTAGQRIVGWQLLCDAVAAWRTWDLLAGSTGEAAELHMPARWLVEDDVRFAVDNIANRVTA